MVIGNLATLAAERAAHWGLDLDAAIQKLTDAALYFIKHPEQANAKLMAELFAVDVRTVSEHLKNIFSSGELGEDSVIRKFRITAADGKSYNTLHYKLPAIIAVGYKVNSERAVQFRKWAAGIIEQALQDVNAARGEPVWYQLYPTDQWPIALSLLARARAAGCEVAVLDIGEALLGLLPKLDFVHAQVLMDNKWWGPKGDGGTMFDVMNGVRCWS